MESYPYQRAEVEKLLRQADALELSREARMRLERILYAMEHGGNISLTCRHYGISRTTLYELFSKFDPKNPASLEDRSKAPRRVPQPRTDEQTVSLIRGYRRKQPQLSKEKIRALLQAEHGILISASTAGRIIERECFFFDPKRPSHQAKLHAFESRAYGDKVAATRRDVAENVRIIIQAGGEDHRESGWRNAAAIVIAVTGASLLVHVKPAHALEGSQYQLHPEFPNQTASGELDGSSFLLQDGAITDTAQPLLGSMYRIAAPAASSSSSSQSSAPSSSSAAAQPHAGGRRGSGGNARTGGITTRKAAPAVTKPKSTEKKVTVPATTPATTVQPTQPRSTVPEQMAPDFRRYVVRPSKRSVREGQQQSPIFGTRPSGNLRGEVVSFFDGAMRGIEVGPQSAWWLILLLIAAIVSVSIAHKIRDRWVRTHQRTPQKKKIIARRRRPARSRRIRSLALTICTMAVYTLAAAAVTFVLLSTIRPAYAASTAPANHWYQGHLLKSDGSAVTTAVTIRLSYWKSADFTAGDLTATGAINMAAANYVSWYEEHTLTPSSDGNFAVELGSVHALPDPNTLPASTLTNLYLQVDVKASGAADSTYDLMDANTSSTAIDRTSILSLPFARNAEFLDQHEVGTGSGSIPVLSTGGSLSLSGSLTINDSNAAHDAVLTFGNDAGAETLKFNNTTNRFELSDDLGVMGDLEVTGTASGDFVFGQHGLGSSGALVIAPKPGIGTGNTLIVDTKGLVYDATNKRVGIGTASPKAALDVIGSMTNPTLWTTGGGVIGDLNVQDTWTGAGGFSKITFSTSNLVDAAIGAKNTALGSYLYFGTSDTYSNVTNSALVIDPTGNVGIGTAAPETALDVAGTISGSALRVANLSTSGALVYSSGSSLKNTAAGASGTLLISQGSTGPKWAIPVGGMVWYLDGTLSVGTTKGAKIRMPFGVTLSSVTMDINGPPTGSGLIADVKKDGVSIFSTKPQIDAGAATGGSNAVFSDTNLPVDAVITLDINQVGSTFAGSGMTLNLRGTRKY